VERAGRSTRAPAAWPAPQRLQLGHASERAVNRPREMILAVAAGDTSTRPEQPDRSGLGTAWAPYGFRIDHPWGQQCPSPRSGETWSTGLWHL